MWLLLVSGGSTIYIDGEILDCVDSGDTVCVASYGYFEKGSEFLEQGRFDSAYSYYLKSYEYIRGKQFHLWKTYLLSLIAYSGYNSFKYFDALGFDKGKYIRMLNELYDISRGTPLSDFAGAVYFYHYRFFRDRELERLEIKPIGCLTVSVRSHEPVPVFIYLPSSDTLLDDYMNYYCLYAYSSLGTDHWYSIIRSLKMWSKNPKAIIRENVIFDFVEAYARLGHEEVSRGYLEVYRRLFPEILSGYSPLLRVLNLASYYNTLGDVYTYMLDDEDKALFYYLEAFRMVDSLGMDRSWIYALLNNNLGMAYRMSGRYEDAIKYLRTALQMNAVLFSDTGQAVSNIMSNLSRIFALAGQYDSAIFYTRMSIDIRRRLYGEDNDLVLFRLLELAELYLKVGDTARVRRILEKAYSIYPDIRYYFYSRYGIAEGFMYLYRSLGNRERAIRFAREILDRKYPVPDYAMSYVRLDYLSMLMESGMEVPSDTIEYHLLMSMKEVENYYHHTDRWLESLLNTLYGKFLHLLPYLHKNSSGFAAIAYGEFLKGRLLSLQVNFSRDPVVDSLRRALYLSLRSGASWEEILGIEARISDRLQSLRSRFHFENVPRIRKGTALLGYIVSDSMLFSYVLSSEDTLLVVKRILKSKLEEDIRSLMKNPEDSSASRVLYSVLVQLLEPVLKGYDRIAISPHGPLYNLPFEILHDGSEYLVEKPFSIYYILSFYTYDEPCSVEGRVLAMGRNDYGGNPALVRNGIDNLIFAEREARDVARIMGGDYLVGENLREEKLYEMDLPRYDVLHFATHALVDTNPVIVLGPMKDTVPWRDNILGMDEVYARLKTGRAVVLSGCRTGHGRIINDREGIANLTRAFIYSGAECIITTSWNLNDISSWVFMREFYRHLRNGEAMDVALRNARLFLLRQTGFENPYFWGAFTLTVFRR